MGGKVAIATGLIAGVVVGGALLGALVAFAPIPTPVPAVTPSPSAAPSPSSTPSPSVPAPTSASPASASPATTSTPLTASATPGAFGVGLPAPSLSVPQLGGGTIDLAALRGKPVWVNFMATWCPSCRDELPVMSGFAARYADKGLVVLVIDVREDQAAVGAFMTSLKVDLPVGLDANGAAQQAWRATALPVHFWIDRDGIVRSGALGGIGPDVMAKSLQTILPGVTVTP